MWEICQKKKRKSHVSMCDPVRYPKLKSSIVMLLWLQDSTHLSLYGRTMLITLVTLSSLIWVLYIDMWIFVHSRLHIKFHGQCTLSSFSPCVSNSPTMPCLFYFMSSTSRWNCKHPYPSKNINSFYKLINVKKLYY
jgi:hypothetical protein